MFRKEIINAKNQASVRSRLEKDIGAIATVFVSSEDPDHPIEHAFDAEEGPGASRDDGAGGVAVQRRSSRDPVGDVPSRDRFGRGDLLTSP